MPWAQKITSGFCRLSKGLIVNSVILLELAERWERDARLPETRTFSEGEGSLVDAARRKAKREAEQEVKKECAVALRTLVSLFGA